MYKIGEFSKVTDFTVKALRYYDKEKIIIPEHRDVNGYRYYSDSNYQTARLLKVLKEFDFSIAEIKDVMSNCSTENDLQFYLQEKKEFISQKIKEERKLMKKIDRFVVKRNVSKEDKFMYNFKIKNYDNTYVISKRFTGSVAGSGGTIPNLYKKANDSVCGDMFTLYHEEGAKEDVDLEICVPVRKEISSSEFKCRKVEGGKAISTLHIGPYEELYKAYKALFDYAHENNIKLGLPIREICIKGPGMVFNGNPAKYETEISYPIVED